MSAPAPAPSRLRMERTPKRVRVYLGGQLAVDTRGAWLVWEVPEYPAYYLPVADVLAELVPSGRIEHSAELGDVDVEDVRIGTVTAPVAARRPRSAAAPELRDLVRLEWDAMDEWLEEDEPVYVHPRNPYARIDVVSGSQHVQVKVGAVVIAESRQPRILIETGAPPRYYLPLSDVHRELFRPSSTVTAGPYKGWASYWSLEVDGTVLEDVVWIYRTPLSDGYKVTGLVSFYNEKLDIYVDGVRQDRPHTEWS